MNLKKIIENIENLIIKFHDFFHITNVQTGKSFFFTMIFFIGFIFSLTIKNQKLIIASGIGLLLSIIAIHRHFNKYNIWEKFKKK
jgi:hypothetical protein